jgi:hypothetical protein
MTTTLAAAPAGIDEVVAQLDFTNLAWKLAHSEEAVMSLESVGLAEAEYRKFLTLKKLYPGMEFVPSKLVDAFWHAHILDTRSYAADCQHVFGYFLHHFPYFGIYGKEDKQALKDAFEETQRIYELHFGPHPEVETVAARCKDHSCHAPSECRCRTPGACK